MFESFKLVRLIYPKQIELLDIIIRCFTYIEIRFEKSYMANIFASILTKDILYLFQLLLPVVRKRKLQRVT